VDSGFAATTSVGCVFQMCGAAIAKARLPTVDSLTGGTTRRLALVERSVRRPGKSSTRVSRPIGNVVLISYLVDVNTLEMKGQRKFLRVSGTAKKTTEGVLNKAGVKSKVLDTVEARK